MDQHYLTEAKAIILAAVITVVGAWAQPPAPPPPVPRPSVVVTIQLPPRGRAAGQPGGGGSRR